MQGMSTFPLHRSTLVSIQIRTSQLINMIPNIPSKRRAEALQTSGSTLKSKLFELVRFISREPLLRRIGYGDEVYESIADSWSKSMAEGRALVARFETWLETVKRQDALEAILHRDCNSNKFSSILDSLSRWTSGVESFLNQWFVENHSLSNNVYGDQRQLYTYHQETDFGPIVAVPPSYSSLPTRAPPPPIQHPKPVATVGHHQGRGSKAGRGFVLHGSLKARDTSQHSSPAQSPYHSPSQRASPSRDAPSSPLPKAKSEPPPLPRLPSSSLSQSSGATISNKTTTKGVARDMSPPVLSTLPSGSITSSAPSIKTKNAAAMERLRKQHSIRSMKENKSSSSYEIPPPPPPKQPSTQAQAPSQDLLTASQQLENSTAVSSKYSPPMMARHFDKTRIEMVRKRAKQRGWELREVEDDDIFSAVADQLNHSTSSPSQVHTGTQLRYESTAQLLPIDFDHLGRPIIDTTTTPTTKNKHILTKIRRAELIRTRQETDLSVKSYFLEMTSLASRYCCDIKIYHDSDEFERAPHVTFVPRPSDKKVLMNPPLKLFWDGGQRYYSLVATIQGRRKR